MNSSVAEMRPEQITARSLSNFSSAFLFLPRDKRLAMKRVYAFFRVVDDVVDEEDNRGRQETLLAFWKEAVIKTYQGSPPHPLLVQLKKSIDRFSIPQKLFLDLIHGCEMDLSQNRYQTFEELSLYCYRVASVVGLVCMKIFEYESPTSEKAAEALGKALQLTNILRDVGIDLEKNRIYLPLEEAARFGVAEQDIQNRKRTPQFFQFMEFQYQRALEFYAQGFTEFKNDREGKLLAAEMMGSVYHRLLEKIKRQNYPVFEKKVRLGFFEKGWILIQTLAKTFVKRFLS